MSPNQVKEMLTLADRAAAAGQGDDVARRLRHKALRWQFHLLEPTTAAAESWERLAAQITQLLPGAATPLRAEDAALIERYAENPIEFYNLRLERRDLCDREFWIAVTARAIEAQAARPGADLMRLSQEAQRSVPEQPELSRNLLERWADAEASRMQTLPPASHVRRVAQLYRTELELPEKAHAMLRDWLEARRRKLGRQDSEGRYQLARDYLGDLRDQETALKLVSEALELEPDPDQPQSHAVLEALGFAKGTKGWSRAGVAADLDARSGAPKSRLPQAGMTAEEVRARLGEPRRQDIVRVGTAGEIIEMWTYRGPPDICVTFRVTDSAPARVKSVASLSRP